MSTLSAIAHGSADNLMHRAADVVIKEQKKLILVPREAPYSAIHLENMLKLSRLGVVIMDANPAFYQNPKTIDDLVNFCGGQDTRSFRRKSRSCTTLARLVVCNRPCLLH